MCWNPGQNIKSKPTFIIEGRFFCFLGKKYLPVFPLIFALKVGNRVGNKKRV